MPAVEVVLAVPCMGLRFSAGGVTDKEGTIGGLWVGLWYIDIRRAGSMGALPAGGEVEMEGMMRACRETSEV